MISKGNKGGRGINDGFIPRKLIQKLSTIPLVKKVNKTSLTSNHQTHWKTTTYVVGGFCKYKMYYNVMLANKWMQQKTWYCPYSYITQTNCWWFNIWKWNNVINVLKLCFMKSKVRFCFLMKTDAFFRVSHRDPFIKLMSSLELDTWTLL